jgi:aryl-alcohol dehydrogenase-like predicted oxidoreductase
MLVPPALDDIENRDRAMTSFNQPRGRMDTRGWGGTLYRYRTDAAVNAIRQYDALARQAGMTLTELALRWCKERTLLTSTLVGHSNLLQLEESLKYFSIEEPLPQDLMWEIDRVHLQNRLPLFSNTRVGSDWNGEGEIGETIP